MDAGALRLRRVRDGRASRQPPIARALRRRLGYAEGRRRLRGQRRRFGGGRATSSAGVAASYDEARRADPGAPDGRRLRTTHRPGASLGAPPGVEVHGFLPDLDLHHAACDIAVVQGGLSTTMELTASGRPFLYSPLGHHFEQQVHVASPAGAARCGSAMDYREADPARIAAALVGELGRPVSYVPVPADGAARAASWWPSCLSQLRSTCSRTGAPETRRPRERELGARRALKSPRRPAARATCR